ncbi:MULTISPECIES: protein-L-isoaspartate(D-aspartate) O-methyltransferase [Caballeronia]|uniref:Protein-L-isoaspartate O-methyltransferase n=1 Tax=Caballeronia zhejiangensis TaxID=871203 RepID=A0A656QQ52_9BURK|nr:MULTISPECIES: protein-L-isoaspartate(D-aspartate) O-methyltransferase [Caballeronia]EKS70563.1 protein-L-isoaspartate O-methyltransferase [Burkholderia sp. SJ98]KDR33624.1 protein-L-isoaspartate O-methyltransferase [Caballeronia zhejiangensis]MDR5788473.1 protein-L-isoaspartate(D-aspartate) O-methyltransferase [Caballeronia sp. LP003]
MNTFEEARERMVERQLKGRGIRNARVLECMSAIARDAFVPPALAEFAYEDSPLPIAAGQTISQPYIVALMLEAADLQPGDHVLDIGTGSGYAAAIAACIAARVDTIERHRELADDAAALLKALGLTNVSVHHADGTLGMPQHAPFDAIIAAAGGPSVPDAWRAQLKIGGRLVMPVGDARESQRLMKYTRTDDDVWRDEDLGGVMFVPLIGAQGWSDEPDIRTDKPTLEEPVARTLPDLIRASAVRLPALGAPDFAHAFDRFADKRVVLLGEASHGTAEFYVARAAITRRLIERHGFSFVAVEADWPDAAIIDEHVRGRPRARPEARPFTRFPTWMWRNTEFAAFVAWLRQHNAALPDERRAAFYGLDLYSLSESIAAVLAYLDAQDPGAARIARVRYGCLTPWQKNPAVYGRAAWQAGFGTCEEAVVAQLRDLLDRRLATSASDHGLLDATHNARLVASAEQYYRAMYGASAESWNLRDTHMFDTLDSLLDAWGPDARAVVWAHNSHLGDASATEMGRMRDELNVGQLCRERFGDDAALIGFGTHAGTVAAASDWEEPMQIMQVRPSRADSYEHQFHLAGASPCLVDLRAGVNDALRDALGEERLERFIGVVYRPDTELYSHYAQAELSAQFDAFVWFDTTRAVSAIEPSQVTHETPETFPFGV